MNLFGAAFFATITMPSMMLNWEAAPLIALVPLLADVGYFVAIDIPELGGYIPQAQTYIVSIGMVCVTLFTFLDSDMGSWYILMSAPFYFLAVNLFFAGFVNKFVHLVLGGWGPYMVADGS